MMLLSFVIIFIMLPNEDLGRPNQHVRMPFRSTFQGCRIPNQMLTPLKSVYIDESTAALYYAGVVRKRSPLCSSHV